MIRLDNLLKYVLCLSLISCGTRDYGQHSSTPPPPVNQPKPIQSEHPRTYQVKEPGYVWRGLRWFGLEDDKVNSLKEALNDDSQTDAFCAFGSTVIGGAILGLVIRFAGNWVFGQSVSVASKSPVWNRIEAMGKTTGQGTLRGALTGAGCYLLLTGLSPIPYSGLLGMDFKGLSSALVLGGLAGIAFSPYARSIVRKNRPLWKDVRRWTGSSELTNYTRYQVAPGLMILGIGAGMGLLVFTGCRAGGHDPDTRNLPPGE